MKMKKTKILEFAALMLVAMVSLSLSSCDKEHKEDSSLNRAGGGNSGDSGDTDTSSIIGTWVKFYEKETKWVLSNGNWVKTREEVDNESGRSAVYFGAGGEYYKMTLGYDGNWEKGSASEYSIQGNNLYITGSSKSRTFSISDEVLKITETELDGNGKEEEVKQYRKM